MNSELIADFHRNGYVLFEPGIPEHVLDGAVTEMEPYWDGSEPIGAAYWDNSRIQDAWKIGRNVKRLATYPTILETLSAIYKSKPLPFQTLNFKFGTEQKPHSDNVHFNSEPFGMMCGVWIALEDIGMDQGPLIYFPGSQALPEMNFEDFGITPDYRNNPQYVDAIERLIRDRGFEPEYGLMSKGQALIWSANIIHGGSKRNRRNLTRRSQVTHYYFSGCKYWRPGKSFHRRYYFAPDWIPYDIQTLVMRQLSPVKNLAFGVNRQVRRLLSRARTQEFRSD